MNIKNHKLRVASDELRAAQAPRAVARAQHSAFPIPHSPARNSQPATRNPHRGISLLEVLISMFVLLFGLMGVAAVFPVGNHYAGKGEQYDRGAALTEAGFAELKARGMLKPEYWYYANDPAGNDEQVVVAANEPAPVLRVANGDFNLPFNATATNTPGYAFVIDPLGTAQGLEATPAIAAGLDYFPYISLIGASTPDGAVVADMPGGWKATGTQPGLLGDRWPIRRVSLTQSANLLLTTPVAETIFRLHDDVTTELPNEDDRPGIQQWRAVDINPTTGNPNNTPKEAWDDTLLARNYTGSYSWFATVVPTTVEGIAALQPLNPRFGSELYEVSVAVCHKREPLPPSATNERMISAEMNVGNELVIYDTNPDAVDAAADNLRAGNWVAVAGVHQGTGQFLMKWYKILSIDEETAENQPLDPSTATTGPYAVRRLMLDGPDWPNNSMTNLRAIIVPGIISVTTQLLPMESL